MGRARTGSVEIKDGRIYARITWTDETGKKRQLRYRAKDETHAREVIKQVLEDLADQLNRRTYRTTMTFKDLADYFTKNYLKPPEYVQGQKVEGLRSYKNCLLYLKVATEHFGNKLLKCIKWKDILNYKVKRLKTPTHHNKEHALATVNRELAYVRRALEVAKQQGWIEKNPFTQGEGLISLACETKRERILSP
jgi:integrase